VEQSIQRLDARNGNTDVLSELDGSAEECLDF
jgi:hypothetical protein